MPAAKRKIAEQKPPKKAERRKKEPEVGPDGFTLSQRVIRLMAENQVGQSELAKLCSEYYATFVPDAEDKVKQQHIFNIVRGQESAWCLPLIAAVFDVSDQWLQLGIGPHERTKSPKRHPHLASDSTPGAATGVHEAAAAPYSKRRIKGE